jgi:hypothetical protein
MAIVIWVLRVFIFWENLKRAERGYAFVHERARSTAFLTRNQNGMVKDAASVQQQ